MYQKKWLDGMWAYDKMDERTKYLYGNIYAQVFSNVKLFAEIYPMARKVDAGIALKTFIRRS